jgi:hypothetical protein
MLKAGGSLRHPVRLHARGSDRDHGTGGAPDAGMLSVAIELADLALRGLTLTRSAYAGLLSDLYEGVRMRMPYRELMDFARATALRAPDDAAPQDIGGGMPQVVEHTAVRGRAAG